MLQEWRLAPVSTIVHNIAMFRTYENWVERYLFRCAGSGDG
jgi:hypothetical protein